MKNLLLLISIGLFFFGCAQDDCECELPEPEDDFYFKFEVNGTQLLYEDEFNVAHNTYQEESGIYALYCKAFLDAESEVSFNSRIGISLYNDVPIQLLQEYDLQDGFRFNDSPDLHPRVIIQYIDDKGDFWVADQALVQIEIYGNGYVRCSFNATMFNIENNNQTLTIQNGEYRLPLVFAP